MAYLRLSGRNSENADVNFEVRGLPCKLGRAVSGPFDILLDADANLSRTHAEIFWDENKGQYYIKVLSKNGIVLNKTKYKIDEIAPLENNAALKIGGTRLYVLFPADGDK